MTKKPAEPQDKPISDQVWDWKIARMLLKEPTMSSRAIAEACKCTEGVIKRRRVSLLERGILARSTTVWDWEAIGLPLKFRIDIQLDQKALLDPKIGGGPIGHGSILKTQEALARFIHRGLLAYVVSGLDNEPRLKNLEEQLFVEDVLILLGNQTADISAIVRAKSHAAILRFVTGGLRMMPAVATTSTFQEAWSCAEGILSRENAVLNAQRKRS